MESAADVRCSYFAASALAITNALNCSTLNLRITRGHCLTCVCERQSDQESIIVTVHASDFDSSGLFSAHCAQYIEENAQACARTEGWLELPKPALTRLLQSDEVRLLLFASSWNKSQSSATQPTCVVTVDVKVKIGVP